MGRDTTVSPLGSSIEASELTDQAVTKAKLNTDIVSIDRTTGKVAAINSTNFTDLDGSNLTNAGGVSILSSGVLTIATNTTAVDVDYVDIVISASQLTALDRIYIEMHLVKTGDQNLMNSPVINGVTTTGALTGTALDILSGTGRAFCKWSLAQDSSQSDQLVWMRKKIQGTSTVAHLMGNKDTNTADLFVSGFTIRLNYYHSATSSAESKVVYNAYVIKGQ